MFWMTLGFVCGICVAQEYPNLPKLRPLILKIYRKITNTSDDSEL
jgi:hypothetical protein